MNLLQNEKAIKSKLCKIFLTLTQVSPLFILTIISTIHEIYFVSNKSSRCMKNMRANKEPSTEVSNRLQQIICRFMLWSSVLMTVFKWDQFGLS